MLPATTLPAALPACEDAAVFAVCAGRDAAHEPAASRTSWREHRKTPPRDGDAALEELLAMGSLWRDRDGVIEEGPVPPEGIVVIGARAGAYAPALDAAAAALAAGPVTGGAGLGLLSAFLTPALIAGALARAGVPAPRAVRSTSPVLAAEVILAAPLHRGTMNMTAVWDACTGRARETCPGYDPPGKSSVSDAVHYVGAKAIAYVLAAVTGPPRPARQAPAPDPAGDGKPPAVCCPACGSPFTAATAGNAGRALSGPVTAGPGSGWCCGLWPGLRAVAEDGTHFDVLRGPGGDDSANSVHFGSPEDSGPNAHMVAATDIWGRTAIAVAIGGNAVSEAHLAARLLPAFGPGMVVTGDRGFPSREGLIALRDTGAHFAMRVSASWKLKRCGTPLPDGTYLTKLSFRGRTVKARVIEFHIDFTTVLDADDPLLAGGALAGGPVITILPGTDGDGDGAAACRSSAPGVKVQVSETFTLITSLLDTEAFPAIDVAALYGDRWTIELVFCELKVTVMAAGTACRSPRPAGVYQELLAAVAVQTCLRLLGAHHAPQAGVPPAGPCRTAPAATTPATPSRKSGPARAATSSPAPPPPTCFPAHPHPARPQAGTQVIPARRQPRRPRRDRRDQADQAEHHPAATGPATSAPPAAPMPRTPEDNPARTARASARPPASTPVTQCHSRPPGTARHTRTETTDSYKIRAPHQKKR
jgi:hypothetical protein